MEAWAWIGFIAIVLALLALDLGVLHRRAHVVEAPEALKWTGVFVACALAFAGVVYYLYENHVFGLGEGEDERTSGAQAATRFITGYLVEYSLSVDNIFVIALIFTHFGVPAAFQHRVLFWGILGALVMRGGMIGLGAAVLGRFEWVIYVFGAMLIFAAWKMIRSDDTPPDLEKSPTVRIARRVLPVTTTFDGNNFLTEVGGKAAATPLLLALVIVEVTDLVFAVDSIPAIFTITTDPFLVFTSNVFAILGLRSLFFALAGMMRMFRYLKHAVGVILLFVGGKMLLAHWIGKLPDGATLGVIGACLAAGIGASLVARKGAEGEKRPGT